MSGSSPQKISIIIPTYNAAGTLQSCLESVYRQVYPNIELLLVDGGSSDGTLEIIKAQTDRIAFWLSEQDEGIYDAMNKALDHSSGDWIYFLGADDELLDGFSSLAFELSSPDVIYYGSVIMRGSKYLGKLSPYQHAKFTINHQAMIYPAAVFRKYRYDTRYVVSADHVLNMWCWKDKDFRFEFKDYVIANFNHTGASSQKDKLFQTQKASLIREHYGIWIWLRFSFKKWKENRRSKPSKNPDF